MGGESAATPEGKAR